uniref:Uncharacterized protein n=1 Tax=Peronospora matthiolae TaxID=2874970 RepID=A0AAV1TSP7_9STRA
MAPVSVCSSLNGLSVGCRLKRRWPPCRITAIPLDGVGLNWRLVADIGVDADVGISADVGVGGYPVSVVPPGAIDVTGSPSVEAHDVNEQRWRGEAAGSSSRTVTI